MQLFIQYLLIHRNKGWEYCVKCVMVPVLRWPAGGGLMLFHTLSLRWPTAGEQAGNPIAALLSSMAAAGRSHLEVKAIRSLALITSVLLSPLSSVSHTIKSVC